MQTNKPSIIFAGTPDFAAAHLQGLVEAGFDVPLVLSQPDARVGRGRKTMPTAVKAYAQSRGIDVAQPLSLKDNAEIQSLLQSHQPTWMVVVAYGLLIPKVILQIPTMGCLNVHGSLLPRWRGAAPVQRAIEAQDSVTGICIMQMDEGLDTGPVRKRVQTAIKPFETSSILIDRLAPLGVSALLAVLQEPEQYPPESQAAQGVTYAHKIRKTEKSIDWTLSADQLEAKLRALQPWPGVMVETGCFQFKILKAFVLKKEHSQGKLLKPGTVGRVSPAGIEVACGTGRQRLVLEVIQLAGSKPVNVSAFLNGNPEYFQTGDLLCDPVSVA